MKLVSVNAVLIASVNVSLFFNSFLDEQRFPSVPLFLLSAIYIALMILLEYEHRQFKQAEVNITESSFLLRKYLFLFAAGLMLTLAQKVELLDPKQHPELQLYTLLGQSIHYSLLYYTLNAGLGITYQWLFWKEYARANRNRIEWEIVSNLADENCAICLNRIAEGQKVAKIECMHHYHLSCLNKWVKKKSQCPLCQSHITLVA
jgi:hypothetical protein